MSQIPTVGRVILTRMDPKVNNGVDVAPAIITRVWSQCANGSWSVNVKVLADHDTSPWKTSLALFDDEASVFPADSLHVGWWPPRA